MIVKNIGVILAGGKGERFCNNIPKQFVKLNGKHIIDYVLDVFNKNIFDKIVVVVPSYKFNYIFKDYDVDLVIGGVNRNDTISAAINYISKKYKSCEKVLFHDSARPFISEKVLFDHLNLLNDNDSVVTCKKITDSLGYDNKSNNNFVDRNNFYLIQTPESFKFNVLVKYFDRNDVLKTAIVHHLSKQCKIKKYFITDYNLKITYLKDLFVGENLIKYDELKKYDVNLDNKNVVVFGSNGGLGSVLVSELSKFNCNCLPLTRRDLDLKKVTFEKLDVLFKNNLSDVYINVSGAYFNDSEGILEHYSEIMDVNLKFNIILLEYLYLRNINLKKINVVLISSSSSSKGRENLTVYSASKCALNSIVESLALKLSKKNIFVNVISPEKINTPLLHKLHINNFNLNETLSVKEVVDVILNYSSCNDFGKIIKLRKGFI